MTTIGERVEHIRKLFPNGPNQYGQLYRDNSDASRNFQKVTLYTIFQSDSETSDTGHTYLLRNHLFESKKARRTPEQWSQWFEKNLTEIHRVGVLPGLQIRTGKVWSVLKILGWHGDARTSTAIKTGKRHGKRRTSRTDRSKPVATKRRKSKRHT